MQQIAGQFKRPIKNTEEKDIQMEIKQMRERRYVGL